jgi:hypothetical protein
VRGREKRREGERDGGRKRAMERRREGRWETVRGLKRSRASGDHAEKPSFLPPLPPSLPPYLPPYLHLQATESPPMETSLYKSRQEISA